MDITSRLLTWRGPQRVCHVVGRVSGDDEFVSETWPKPEGGSIYICWPGPALEAILWLQPEGGSKFVKKGGQWAREVRPANFCA